MTLKFVHFLTISLLVLVSFLLFFITFNEECNLLQSTNANVERQISSYVRGCYFTNWAQHRPDGAKFLPENYIPGLCTHIYYAFVLMNDDFTLKPSDPNEDKPGGLYERVLALKKQQNDLKIILSFAGALFSMEKKQLIKSMIAESNNRKKFIQSSYDYVVKHRFDGLDLDWEVPEASDKENFANLLKEMSAFYHSKGLLLTAAVVSYQKKIDESYDVPVLGQTLDMVNIMTYDFHGSGWDPVTGFNAPLFERNGDKLSVSTTVEYYVSKGLPRNKIVVGFATYGKSWTLTDVKVTKVGSPGSAGPAGPYTKEAGMLSYYEICDMIAQGAVEVFDETQKVPYIVIGSTWVGYDDKNSFKIKLDWLKTSGYKGAFIWALDLDDFNGMCPGGQGSKYPLLRTIAQSLSGKTVQSTTSKPNIVVTTISDGQMTTNGGGGSFLCPDPGLFPDPENCSKFYSCDNAKDAHHMDCPQGLHFNEKLKFCDWPANAMCKI